jgi:ABC-2 type transport system permease protein
MLAYMKFEARRLVREPRLIVLTLVLPVIVFTIASNNVGQLGGVDVATYIMVSMAAYGVLVGVLSIGVSVSQERASGWLRQLRITPLAPVKVVAAKALLGSLLAIPTVAVVGVVAATSHDVSLSAGQWLALFAALWVGSLPFAALGLALGFWLSPQLTQPAMMLSTFGLAFLGGLFWPVEAMPKTMARIATWLPSNRYAELGWSVVADHAPTARAVAILAGWTIVLAGLAALSYRASAAKR